MRPDMKQDRTIMGIRKGVLALAALFCWMTAAAYSFTVTEKPWTYWWWMGNSVKEADITEQLEGMSRAGLGGVHIIPIYGEKGDEANYIPYLSERWMEVLSHTIREADRLGMGVDMTMGTGWPFGGPDIPEAFRAQRFRIEQGEFKITPTGQKVKRAAPGGEGFVLDPFSREAIEFYAQRFRDALAPLKQRPRAFYNDSYEVYGANCTQDFLEQFRALRGYDLKDYLGCLDPKSSDPAASRVVCDYCETISDLIRDQFAARWVELCHQMGVSTTRYEAHGSPGNLLDLYALADIPETESFGASTFKIPGLRHDPKYEPARFGHPDPLVMKFASSAAHVTGKPLVSSESTTWLGDHFSVSLSQIKPQIDELFTAGINHIFFHGTTYSPYWKDFPGRLFYASTHYGHTSHFFEELPVLTAYIAECQHILQQSESDNDILIYFPIYDIWSQTGRAEVIRMLDVHYLTDGLYTFPFGTLVRSLWTSGYTFDYISDTMLKERAPRRGQVVLVPPMVHIPHQTMEALLALAEKGTPVIFMDDLPGDVPGLFQHKERCQRLFQVEEALRPMSYSCGGSQEVLAYTLERLGIRPEPFKANGIDFIRKKQDGKTIYFLTNLSDRSGDCWVPCKSRKITLFDPAAQTRGIAQTRRANGQTEFHLQLAPGQSIFVFCGTDSETDYPVYQLQTDGVVALDGDWRLSWKNGVPKIEEERLFQTGKSWTELGSPYDIFSGKLIYSRKFSLTPEQLRGHWRLDLGDVHETARVTLNGTTLPLLWHIPFAVTLPDGLLRAENTLEIEVTNLSYNRIIDMDRRKVPWKNFHEINFVNIQYKNFDASEDKPLDSGLLSVPKLIPVRLENTR